MVYKIDWNRAEFIKELRIRPDNQIRRFLKTIYKQAQDDITEKWICKTCKFATKDSILENPEDNITCLRTHYIFKEDDGCKYWEKRK